MAARGKVSVIENFAAKRRKTTRFEASKQLLALAKCFGISGPFEVRRVQIPSGTPILFSNLRFHLLLYIGTKKAQIASSKRMYFIESPMFSH
jgi:hypothetical protein